MDRSQLRRPDLDEEPTICATCQNPTNFHADWCPLKANAEARALERLRRDSGK